MSRGWPAIKATAARLRPKNEISVSRTVDRVKTCKSMLNLHGRHVCTLRQLAQQPFGLLQIVRAEALGEAGVDRRERLARLARAPLVAPQSAKAGGRAQFP